MGELGSTAKLKFQPLRPTQMCMRINRSEPKVHHSLTKFLNQLKRPLQLHHHQRASHPTRGLRVFASQGEESSNFPFVEESYVKAKLHMVQQGLAGGQDGGYLLFLQDGESKQGQEAGLVLAVGGDTFQAIIMLLQGQQHRRPLTVDLLWKVLQRGQEISRTDWKLLRMAIVDMRESTFIGRLYFGDPNTTEVVWEVDCRPSDGTWLALKSRAPIYVSKHVWSQNCTPLAELGTDEEDSSIASGAAGGEGDLSADPAVMMAQVRDSDPEPLKRLKRELQVALKDEDYAAAARIRDHPYTQLYMASVLARKEGRINDAKQHEEALKKYIENVENRQSE